MEGSFYFVLFLLWFVLFVCCFVLNVQVRWKCDDRFFPGVAPE